MGATGAGPVVFVLPRWLKASLPLPLEPSRFLCFVFMFSCVVLGLFGSVLHLMDCTPCSPLGQRGSRALINAVDLLQLSSFEDPLRAPHSLGEDLPG